MTSDTENESTEQIDGDPAAGDTVEEGGGTPSLFSRFAFPRRRLFVGGLIILAAVFGGVGYLSLMRHAGPGPAADLEEGIIPRETDPDSSDLLVKQDLAPFYVPLSGEGGGRMARVSFSVTWDKTSSKRFLNREPLVRDQIYLRITELATEGKNIQDMSPTVRMEAQKILEDLLRPDVLTVVVTGILIV